jgi:hypothetical protein
MEDKEQLDDRLVGFVGQIIGDPATSLRLVAADCIGDGFIHQTAPPSLDCEAPMTILLIVNLQPIPDAGQAMIDRFGTPP